MLRFVIKTTLKIGLNGQELSSILATQCLYSSELEIIFRFNLQFRDQTRSIGNDLNKADYQCTKRWQKFYTLNEKLKKSLKENKREVQRIHKLICKYFCGRKIVITLLKVT